MLQVRRKMRRKMRRKGDVTSTCHETNIFKTSSVKLQCETLSINCRKYTFILQCDSVVTRALLASKTCYL